MQAKESGSIFTMWFLWQFYEAPKFLVSVWKNYFFFAADFFSLPLLLRSILSPWRKYRWVYPKITDFTEFLNTLFSNVFSRIVGAFMRIILIIAGIIFQAIVIVAGFAVILAWYLVPLTALAGILFAILY